MANTASNAVVGKPAVSGGILTADVGSITLPTDEASALPTGALAVGYITDDGVTRTESPDTDTKKAWGGDLLAVLFKSIDFTAKFAMAEYLNPVAQAAIYGSGNVTVTPASSSSGQKMKIVGKSTPSPHKTWIFEMFWGSAKIRVIFPDAQISDRDDVSYKDDDIAARGVTLTLFPDASGNYFYEYTNDGKPTAS